MISTAHESTGCHISAMDRSKLGPWNENSLNAYAWIFGTITDRVFWKKNPESSLVTSQLGLQNIKIICTKRVSVRLYCDVNFKWHMPIYAEICRAEQKYMPFVGTITERAFWKNSKYWNISKWCNAAVWIFSGITRSVRVLFFFQDSRIRVKEKARRFGKILF